MPKKLPAILLALAGSLFAQKTITSVFVGPGLNDLTSGGKFTARDSRIYKVIISSTGAPDRFRWAVDDGPLSQSIDITGAPQHLSDGVTITFGATSGHTLSTSAKSFWNVSATVGGSVAQTSFRQRGIGAVARSTESKLRDTVEVRDFGAKCDGATDDTKAIQNAIDSLPLGGTVGSYNPQGVKMVSGVVELPYQGTAVPPGCVISDTLQIPNYVKFGARGGFAGLRVAPNFAPALGSADITNVTYTPPCSITGATNSSPIVVKCENRFSDGMTVVVSGVKGNAGANGTWVISSVSSSGFTLNGSTGRGAYISDGTAGSNIVVTAANNFSNGDTVSIQGVRGLVAANTYMNAIWNNAGLWTITNVTATSFQLANTYTLPEQPAYTSGGTAIKGVEKFVINIVNATGTGTSPNTNFDVGLEHFQIGGQAAGNEFASGIYCNCSIGTYINDVAVHVGYRGFVTASGGVDNITINSLTVTPAPFSDGPDPQALVISAVAPNITLNITNLKVTSWRKTTGLFTADTPAVVLGNNVYATSFHGMNFEMVGWPILVSGYGLYGDLDLGEIIAFTDYQATAPGTSCDAFSNFPRVVQIITGANYNGGGIRISGTYQCYGAGVVWGSTPVRSLAVPNPSGADTGWYSLGFEEGITSYLGGSEFHATGLRTNVAPSGNGPFDRYYLDYYYRNTFTSLGSIGSYFPSSNASTPAPPGEAWTTISASNGSAIQPAGYFRGGGGLMWPRPAGAPAGSQCWGLFPGSAGTDSNPGFEIWSYGSCTNFSTRPHLYERFSQAGGGACASNFHVCLDPTGTENVGIGGNLDVAGKISGKNAIVTVTPGPGLSGGGPVAPGSSITLTNTAPLNSISPGVTCSGSTPHVTGVTAFLNAGAITLTVTCGP